MTDLSGAGVRIVILATATHAGAALPPLATVPTTFEDLRQAFVDRCGAVAENVVGVLNPPDARSMASVIADEAARARSVLVVYFIGHGLRGPGGELYLAAVDTDELIPGLAAHQALSFAALAQAVQRCRAPAVVVILDCCFSGIASLDADTASIQEFASGAHGRYLIGSAEHLSSAPAGQRHTAFTGALLQLLEHGDPREPTMLTLDSVFDGVYRLLRDAQRGPLPRRQAGDHAGGLIIARNPAATLHEALEQGQAPGRCPYPGLAPFGPEDAEMFFGRSEMLERLLVELATATRDGGLRVLVGASGAGKTSLLNAGVIAAVRERGLPGVDGSVGWPVRRFTPGADPLQRLAGVLNIPDTRILIDADTDRIGELTDVVRPHQSAGTLVLIVDQIEELFTVCTDPTAPAVFLAALATLAAADASGRPRALVALALRADFYGHAAAHPELAAALRDSQILIEPMTRPQLQEVIERPAAMNGWSVADGLAELILNDLGPDASAAARALPLLSHVMSSTWRNRTGTTLTVAGYRATGGIAHAIKHSAEDIFNSTGQAGRDALRVMLPRLVRVGENGDTDTAQPTDRMTFTHGVSDPIAAQSVLRQLVAQRLITMDHDTVRLGHEALLREWPRLGEWIDADRDWRHHSQRFITDSYEWQRSGSDPALLYRGSRLAAITDRNVPADRDLILADPVAAKFLAVSVRAKRLRRRLQATVAVVLTVLLVVTVAAAVRAQIAGRERDAVFFATVLAEADRLQNSDPTLSAELDVLAQRLRPGDPQVATRLISSVTLPVASTFIDHPGSVRRMAYLGNGRLITAGDDHAIRVWNTGPRDAPTLAAPPIADHTDQVVALAAHSTTLISGSLDRTVRIRDISDPDHPRLLHTLDTAAAVVTTVLSGDGRTLAIATTTTIELWDITNPDQPAHIATLPSPGGRVETVGFAGPAAVVAETTTDTGPLSHISTVWAWPILSEPGQVSPAELARVSDGPLVFATSPDIPLMAVAGRLPDQRLTEDAQLNLVDVHDPAHPAPVATAISLPSAYDLDGIALSRNGRVLATVTGSATTLWNLADTVHPTALGPPLAGAAPCPETPGQCTTTPTALTMTPDATQVAIAFPNGVVQHWSVPAAALAGQAGRIDRPAISGDGSRMLTTAYGSPAHIWDIRDPAAVHLLGTIDAPGTAAPDISGTSFPTLSHDGHLAAYPTHGVITVFDISEPAAPREIFRFPAAIGAGFSPLQPVLLLLQALPVPEITFWDFSDPAHPIQRNAPMVLPASPRALTTGLEIAASRDGRLAASLADTMQIWDIQHTLRDHTGPLGSIPANWSGNGAGVAISADDHTVVAGWDAGTIRIFDITDPKRIATVGDPIQVSRTIVSAVALTTDDHFLITGGADSTVRLFDFTNPHHPMPYGQSIASPGPTRWQLAYHPHPDYLIGAADQGTLRIWDLNPDHAITRTCTLTASTITSDLTTYLPGHRFPSLCPDRTPR
ncbi:caspase family protein [Nocardia sp. NPDC051900]|uniref:caspase, EACC1-associated type n=1 Tax=Nocardia sp. NPDC051900 TaxID=3364326 RepID=UPI0037A02289